MLGGGKVIEVLPSTSFTVGVPGHEVELSTLFLIQRMEKPFSLGLESRLVKLSLSVKNNCHAFTVDLLDELQKKVPVFILLNSLPALLKPLPSAVNPLVFDAPALFDQ